MRYHFFSNDTTRLQCDTTFFKRYHFFRYRRYHFTFSTKNFKIQTNHFFQRNFLNGNFLFENINRQMKKILFENNNRQMEKFCLKILIAKWKKNLFKNNNRQMENSL
jgi:hypothetical protein